MNVSTDRLRELDEIEKQLQIVLQSAGAAIQELSKDKPTIKQVEQHSTSFLNALKTVEQQTSKQIQYLTQSSTGQAHEGSCYASQKVLNMAWHRIEHARLRLNDLDRCRMQYLQQTSAERQSQQQQHQMQMQSQQAQVPQPPPPPQQQQLQHQQQQQFHQPQQQQQPQPPPPPHMQQQLHQQQQQQQPHPQQQQMHQGQQMGPMPMDTQGF